MPILAVRIVKNPRRVRYCPECLRRIDGETIDLYGMAEYGDKPYHLYLHRTCIKSTDALGKIRAAEHCVHPSDGGSASSAQDNKPATPVILATGDDPDNAPHSVSG